MLRSRWNALHPDSAKTCVGPSQSMAPAGTTACQLTLFAPCGAVRPFEQTMRMRTRAETKALRIAIAGAGKKNAARITTWYQNCQSGQKPLKCTRCTWHQVCEGNIERVRYGFGKGCGKCWFRVLRRSRIGCEC